MLEVKNPVTKEKRLKDRGMRDALSTIGASLVCVIIGLVLGFIVLLVLAYLTLSGDGMPNTFGRAIKTAYNSGFKQILLGGFFMSPLGVGREISLATPLIMCGLSVGCAFKTGLFNIGAAGQYTLGAFGGILFATIFRMPWYVCLLAATVFGAAWGAIPGILKALLNINEVISSIMTNWIGLYAVNTIMYGGGASAMYDPNKTKTWQLREAFPSSIIPDFGMGKMFMNRSTTIAIFFAILAAILIYILIFKTNFGFELRACGSNRNAAKYAGINEKKSIILSMVIAGALAGFGGGLYYLSGVAEWNPMDSAALPAMGFNGIAVALLAASHPLGIIFSAFLIAHINTGGGFMNATVFPPEIASIISGVIVYFCAFALLFKNGLASLGAKKKAETIAAVAADSGEASVPPGAQTQIAPDADEKEA